MNAILNVACGSWYRAGQDRLRESVETVGERVNWLFWSEQWPGVSHQESPYQFKVDAFRAAAKREYPKALWCDSSVWLVSPLAPVWDWIDRNGVFLIGDDWNLAQWASDAALDIYGISRDQAEEVQLTYNVVVGINLQGRIGNEFLGRWADLAERGAFVGSWGNDHGEASADPRCLGHRHDQSAASWLAHDMGIPLAPMEEFLTIGREGADLVFRAEGM